MKNYTYIHYTKDTHTPFYIGHGSDYRYSKHSPRSIEWKNKVAKHGLIPEILAYWSTKEEAAEHEKVLIDCFRSMGYQLINKSSGGIGGGTGVKKTQDELDRRSKKTIGQVRDSVTGKNNGRYKGTTIGTHMITGEVITFESSKEMKEAGFDSTAIYRCINGHRKHHKNYIWTRK